MCMFFFSSFFCIMEIFNLTQVAIMMTACSRSAWKCVVRLCYISNTDRFTRSGLDMFIYKYFLSI